MRHALYGMAAAVLLLPAAALAADDPAQFAKKAAHGNMLEVELGELAADKAQNEAVKQFGERMVQDHSKAQEKLEAAAEEADVDLPDGLDEKGQKKVEEMESKSGAEFDKAYMDEMVKDHEKDIQLYEQQSDAGEGPIQSYAAETLPVLRHHHELAEQARQQVK